MTRLPSHPCSIKRLWHDMYLVLEWLNMWKEKNKYERKGGCEYDRRQRYDVTPISIRKVFICKEFGVHMNITAYKGELEGLGGDSIEQQEKF